MAQVSNQPNKVQGSKIPQSKFCSKCNAWFGQLGLEPDFRMYVKHVVEIGREIKRVLKKNGSWYLNLGDTYASSLGRHGGRTVYDRLTKNNRDSPGDEGRPPVPKGMAKCKLLIPYRVALALIDDGWICRNDITWYKPNAMPSSVKDRLTCQTERIFHFVKSRKYYYDLDAIREPYSMATIKRISQPNVFNQRGGFKQDILNPKIEGLRPNFNQPAEMVKSIARRYALGINLKGKNPGDLWEICTRPFPKVHFAVYPPQLLLRPILSSCPPDGIVLDPMVGSGTTCAVAKALGRKWIGIDLNENYVNIARKRIERVVAPLSPIINIKEAEQAVEKI